MSALREGIQKAFLDDAFKVSGASIEVIVLEDRVK